jgi:hypothetical protein
MLISLTPNLSWVCGTQTKNSSTALAVYFGGGSDQQVLPRRSVKETVKTVVAQAGQPHPTEVGC